MTKTMKIRPDIVKQLKDIGNRPARPDMHNDISINEISDIVLEAANCIELMQKVLKSLLPEKSGHFFICGEAGNHDEMGLPDKLFVCPTYGLDGFQVYKKEGEYRAPGW